MSVPAGVDANLSPIAALAAQHNLTATSGLRPGSITSSGNVSMHSSGDAIDWAGKPADMLAFARDVVAKFGSRMNEVIYLGLGEGQIKNGKTAGHEVYGNVIEQHDDHVHTGYSASLGPLSDGATMTPVSLVDAAKGPLTAMGVPIPALGGAGDAAQDVALAPVRALFDAFGADGARLLVEIGLILSGAVLVLWGVLRVASAKPSSLANVVPAGRVAKAAKAAA